jgi:hypothetical protein
MPCRSRNGVPAAGRANRPDRSSGSAGDAVLRSGPTLHYRVMLTHRDARNFAEWTHYARRAPIFDVKRVNVMTNAIPVSGTRDRRWLILVLGVIALAQLMVVLDLTVMNIPLPSAQRASDQHRHVGVGPQDAGVASATVTVGQRTRRPRRRTTRQPSDRRAALVSATVTRSWRCGFTIRLSTIVEYDTGG